MSSKQDTRDLATPVQFLKKVGPDRAKLLEKLGIRTARDVLFFFPRDYADLTQRKQIADLEPNETVSVVATVEEVEQRVTRSGRIMLGVLFGDGSDTLRGVWFNQPFMRNRFARGQSFLVAGTPQKSGISWQMVHPQITPLGDDETAPSGEILPVYRLTEGLKQHHLRNITKHAIDEFVELLPEVLPDSFRHEQDLIGIQSALSEVHCPTSRERLDRARKRLVYQELLVMQLGLALRRQQLTLQHNAPQLPLDGKIDARIRRLFPYSLTPDQDQAISEITADLNSDVPMNRLLQGDVGTGKTAVAVYAMLLSIAHGHQAVLMSPTEVLAQQHFDTLTSLLRDSHVRIGLLSGAVRSKPRQAIEQAVSEGEIDLLVGTHAIVRSELQFNKLALVIIDEQHKFGVMQRAGLRQGEVDPHYLVMTATPIPRTIAMTLFGDLDTSVLRSRPPGRQTVHTYLADETQRDRWWEFFRQKLRQGRQGFVISPRVQDSDDETTSAEAALEHLSNGQLADFRVDLLHGRMSSEEKLRAIHDFQSGDTQVLVATSVIEVGIDVTNATVMTIEHGEQFGLAQLHQLRGRVGRGNLSGHVCVFSDPKNDESQQRLQALVESNDGFELAECDFRLRGPGELFGTRQHGMPPLMVADVQRDAEILERARRDAQGLIQNDPEFRDPAFAKLREMVIRRYGRVLSLSDVG